MYLDEEAIRAAWGRGAAHSLDAMNGYRLGPAAHGAALGELAPDASWAAGELEGLTRTAASILSETKGKIDTCIQTFHATDQRTAGTFNGVNVR
ncbi:MAG: hypothetical protein Q3997_07960 [Propionibacteriaceae bacterium]|nr:hypothetical protein [Propionibacteriaceae bacterium]